MARKRWSATTLLRELQDFADDNSLGAAATYGQIEEKLHEKIVADAVAESRRRRDSQPKQKEKLIEDD